MIETIYQFFKQNGLELGENELGMFVKAVQFREYPKKNQILLNANEVENYCYIIVDGVLRIYHFEDGREYTRNIFTEGDFFTESVSYFSRKSFGFQIDTLEPSKVYRIPRQSFEEIQSKSLTLQNFFAKQLEKALVFMILKNTEFQKTAMERYQNLRKMKPQLFGRVPDYILSSYLNLTPEVFSRTQKQYESDLQKSNSVK